MAALTGAFGEVDAFACPHGIEERELLHVIEGAAVDIEDGEGSVGRRKRLCHAADALLHVPRPFIAVVVQAAEPDILVPAPKESYATRLSLSPHGMHVLVNVCIARRKPELGRQV